MGCDRSHRVLPPGSRGDQYLFGPSSGNLQSSRKNSGRLRVQGPKSPGGNFWSVSFPLLWCLSTGYRRKKREEEIEAQMNQKTGRASGRFSYLLREKSSSQR